MVLKFFNLLLGAAVIILAAMIGSAAIGHFATINDRLEFIANECIRDDRVKANVDDFAARVIDAPFIRIDNAYTKHILSKSQIYEIRFGARKRRSEPYTTGQLEIYLDNRTCALQHHILHW